MRLNPTEILQSNLEACRQRIAKLRYSLEKNACLFPMTSAAEHQPDDVNVGANVGANVGVNHLFVYIQTHPGQRASEMATAYKLTQRTIERWLKQLKDRDLIEFRGATKTGGYFAMAHS